jgi:anaerobic selenocysteine-containing dehydrogenase
MYLMERALEPPGETRSLTWVLKALAERLALPDFYPWASEEAVLDAILDHPSTGGATVASLRAQGGIGALNVSSVGHPTLRFDTPSGKVEFYSARAEALGLPPLPMPPVPSDSDYPLRFSQGRTLSHFHGFYDHGQALPALAALNGEPEVWLAIADAEARRVSDGDAIRVFNERGTFRARAHVTDKIPAGVVWTHDGWTGLNALTSGRPVLPDAAVDLFHFSAGQAAFDARVDVAAA